MKKICFVAPADNYHTQKWCKWFSENGYNVSVISFTNGMIKNTDVHYIDVGAGPQSSDINKLKYLLCGSQIRKIINEIKPSIVNVHYATSYGTVMGLSGIKNYVLSVWGADVYDFPNKSILHKMMLKFSLSRARYLFSTSKAMAVETSKYTDKNIFITPFGVDTRLFCPQKRIRPFVDHTNANDEDFIVGTVKALTEKYGIDYLLHAVAIVKKNHPEIPLKLRIAGKGYKEVEYKKLASFLGISDITTWLGFISQENAAYEWANMDLAIVYSTLESESFGVSAVEAEASGTPLIISDIPGLMEACDFNKTCIVIERKNYDALADAIISLYYDEQKRKKMGIEGLKFVRNNYEINNCFIKVKSIYDELFH